MMLDEYQRRLRDANWIIEAGDPISPQPLTQELKVLWMARKNGVTLVVTDRAVRVIRGVAWSSTPIDVVMRGHILLPGALSEKYLPSPVNRGDLIPHEGQMTAEELELRRLLG